MPQQELAKIYDSSKVESKWYSNWIENKLFQPDMTTEKPSFTIMIPPPNVTGILHIGHVLNNTIQDVLMRRARMLGKNSLWLPGTDHASIATEAKVTKMLKEKGINKKEIGRDKFLEHAYEWKETYGGTIIKQLKELGCSCDWSREKFTMDEDYSIAVTETFVKLYNDGLIYRGERIINWDPVGLTAVSDEEVIHRESQGNLWYFKYPIKNTNEYLTVATTRPETMLGDTGVAINPSDERYQHLIGKSVILPIANREIPIFADNYVDKEFGTGCVKVTPAHDPNDFDMGQRNGLEIINIMHPNATLNENTPEKYQGLDRYDARKEVLNDLEKLGLLEKIEDYTNKVGHSERTDAVIEPYLSKQWFVKMKPLAEPALKVVNDGQIQFHPNRWTKTYNHWLENIRDWCISRQLWWGHRIPVWYRGEEIYCGTTAPDGGGWTQEEDVLDTWFSSWLWPFATLGWPEDTDDLKRFFPSNDLVTGPDIIFFWVARMIMASLYFKKEIPFTNVYFTGMIRDEQGRKMSKSLGNSPDPLDLIEKYGADALRTGLMIVAPQGTDILFAEEKIQQGRNFMNKLWNSTRFVLMNLDDELPINLSKLSDDKFDETDRWILSKLNRTIEKVDIAYNNYKINEAVKIVYDFAWGDFCDWYVEFTKARFYGLNTEDRKIAQSVSVHVLKQILQLLHPFAPFITEEIWSYFTTQKDGLITLSQWPIPDKSLINKSTEDSMQVIMDVISAIRNVKTKLNISPAKPISLAVRGEDSLTQRLVEHKDYLQRLARVEDISVGKNMEKPKQAATAVLHQMEIFIPLEGLINIDKEIDRLNQQIEDLQGRLNAVNKKLSNENFVSRAPEKVVTHEKEKQQKYKTELDKLVANLEKLK
jgi:valyl-tRNA synthetase